MCRANSRIVVAVVEEVVTASERCVGLEFVVGGETSLATAAEGRGLGGSVSAETELGCDQVAVESNTLAGQRCKRKGGKGTYKCSQDDSEVIADVVDVLLGLDELVEGDDTISTLSISYYTTSGDMTDSQGNHGWQQH